ncbi:hypothetical protein AB7M16_006280 [Bradyrhizobium sp. USDA 372]
MARAAEALLGRSNRTFAPDQNRPGINIATFSL